MNSIQSIKMSAMLFAVATIEAIAASDSNNITNRINSLVIEVLKGTGGTSQDNLLQIGNTTVKTVFEVWELAKSSVQNAAGKRLEDSLTKLTDLVTKAIGEALPHCDTNESWLRDFLSLDGHILAGLVKNPKLYRSLTKAVQAVGPNFLTRPEQKVTLLIRLLLVEQPKIRGLGLQLLEHPDVNLKHTTQSGCTVFHLAAMRDDAELIKALIAKGSDPLAITVEEKIPLDFCNRSESAKAILDAVDFGALIGGESFADRILKMVPDSDCLNDSIDIERLVTYLREKQVSTDTVASLNRAAVRSETCNFITKLLSHGHILEGLSHKIWGYVVDTCIQEGDKKALRTLLCAQHLPIGQCDLFTQIERDGMLAKELRKDVECCKNKMGPEAVSAYQALARDLGSYVSPIVRTVKMEAIDHNFQVLIDSNVKGATQAKAEFDSMDDTVAQRKYLSQASAILEKNESSETKVREAIHAGEPVFQVLNQLAWLIGDDALLGELGRLSRFVGDQLYSETRAADKIVANVALDKAFYVDKDRYKGGAHYWIAPFLANALTAARSRVEENLKAIQQSSVVECLRIVDQCRQELVRMLRWCEGGIHFSIKLEADWRSNRRLQSQDLIDKINSLSVGESCLVPVEIRDHATLIRVERSSPSAVRLLMFNTGEGVAQFHAAGSREGTYQTYLEYSGVPLEDLQNPQDWTDLITTQSRSVQSMPDVYERLKKICKRGVKKDSSKFIEHYEAVQTSGSCAYMCFLAMIRERLVSSLADPREGLGLYKLVKAELLHGLEELTRALRSKKINALFQTKLRVMECDIAIARALSHRQTRDEFIATLRDVLSKHQLTSLNDDLSLAKFMIPLALFALVRRYIKTLSQMKVPVPAHKLIGEAIQARQDWESQQQQGLMDMLNAFHTDPTSSNVERWAKVIRVQLLRGPMRSTALDWVATRLTSPPKSEDDVSASSLLLRRLVQSVKRQDKKMRERLLLLLVQRYQNPENLEMIIYLCDF